MSLLDTTDEQTLIAEDHVPHGSLLREHEKFKTSESGEDKIKRLVRIQKIVKADPGAVLKAMELMLGLQSEEEAVLLQIREVLISCFIEMLNGKVNLDPELCTGAMELLAKIDFPNDRGFLYEMDKILLKKFPYSYTIHSHIQKRESLGFFEAELVDGKVVKSLNDL